MGLFVHSTSRSNTSKPMALSGHKNKLEPVPFSLVHNLSSKSPVRASASLASLDPELDKTVNESIEEYCESQLSSLTLEKEAILQKKSILEQEIAEMAKGLEKKQQSIQLVEEALKRDQEIVERFNSDISRLKEAIYSGHIYLSNLEGKKGRLSQALLDLDEEDKRVHHDLYQELAALKQSKKALEERAEELAEEKEDLLHKLQAKQAVFQLSDQQRTDE